MNWRCAARGFVSFLVAVSLVVGLVGCGDRSEARLSSPAGSPQLVGKAGKISEVSPPEVIQTLRQSLDKYQPQVSILSPRPSEILQDNTVSVRFQITDLPLFKDAQLGLGPHLHVILDNEPYEAVYNVDQPLVLKDVAPGTHTLRVFASRPWHESFKNEGAYAQTTFHVFTKTQENTPSPELPLLTYSRPKGDYGAEPIMLDFYLTNAPLHLVAQEEDDDDISDWRIRCTINGESFVFDRWQPLYLKGFQPGKNWVQLELLNEKGQPIENAFNNTVRLITYDLNGQDTLSKLVRGEITADQARGIVDPNYKPQATTPAPVVTPTPAPKAIAPLPSPVEVPAPIEAPPETEQPLEEEPEEQLTPIPSTESVPEPKASQPPVAAPPQIQQPELPKSGGFFNRFRTQPTPIYTTPKPNFVPRSKPELPEVIQAPESEALPDIQPEPAIAPPPKPTPEPTPEAILETAPPPAPDEPEAAPELEAAPSAPPVQPELEPPAAPQPGGFFNRFRRSAPSSVVPTPSPVPTLPDLLEAPTSDNADEVESTPTELQEAVQEPSQIETPRKMKPTGFFHLRPPAPSLAPDVIEAPNLEPSAPADTTELAPVEVETQAPALLPEDKPKTQPIESKPGGFFNRFQRPAPSTPVPTPAASPVPQAIEAPEVAPIESSEPAIAPEKPSVAEPPAPEPTLESKYGDIFERLHQATPNPVMPAPIVTPTLPEVVVPKPKPVLPRQTTPAIRKRQQPTPTVSPAAPKEVPIIQAPESSDRLQQLREKFAVPSSSVPTDAAEDTEATVGTSAEASEVEPVTTP